MNDSIFHAMIAALAGGIGFYALREFKAYRRRVISKRAEIWGQAT